MLEKRKQRFWSCGAGHGPFWLMIDVADDCFAFFEVQINQISHYSSTLSENVIHPVKHLRTTLSNLQSIHKKWHLPPHYYFWKPEKKRKSSKMYSFEDQNALVSVWYQFWSCTHSASQQRHTHTQKKRVFVWWVTCEVTNLLARNHLVSLIWRRLWYFLFDGEKGESALRENQNPCLLGESELR